MEMGELPQLCDEVRPLGSRRRGRRKRFCWKLARRLLWRLLRRRRRCHLRSLLGGNLIAIKEEPRTATPALWEVRSPKALIGDAHSIHHHHGQSALQGTP